MAVGNVNGSYGSAVANTRQAPNSSTLTMDSFMLLLAKQLENQDLNNPMSNSEMMQQLTSMATVQAMNTATELSSTQYALGLMGQTVRVAGTNELTNAMEIMEGKVIGINLSEMKIYIEGSETGYGLGNVMEVGVVPKKEEDEDNKEDNKEDDTVDPTPGGDNSNTRSGGVAPQSSPDYAQMVYSSPQAAQPVASASSDSGKQTSQLNGINYSVLSPRAQEMARSTSIDPDKAAALARQSNQSLPEDKARALESQRTAKVSRPDGASGSGMA